jgi:hypothetical protein
MLRNTTLLEQKQKTKTERDENHIKKGTKIDTSTQPVNRNKKR